MRTRLQVAGNELLRCALRGGVWLAGHAMRLEMSYRVSGYRREQERLRRRYGIEASSPIHAYDAEVRATVEAHAARHADTRYALSSGSTGEPKRIPFTRARLRGIKRCNFSVIARAMSRYRVPRIGLFILSGLEEDDSLSTLILSDHGRPPPYLSGLLMPARYLAQPAMRRHVERYGATAARLWLLVLSNPGIIYSTNPSTLALFLTRVYEDWTGSTGLVRDFIRGAESFDETTRRIARRVASPGWRERMLRVAAATTAVPMAEAVCGLRLYCCWDGGYVRPFLDQVRSLLPPDRFRHLPMYSMSTETIETLNYFDGDEVRFLAVAPGVYYEFLPAGANDEPALLLPAWRLRPGQVYSMVVSDPYGLVRYQTEDLFRCAAMVGDVPDLRFLRRRGLSYSFTGEKLTDEQLETAFGRLRAAFPELAAAGVQLTLIPAWPPGVPMPRYRLALAHTSAGEPVIDTARVSHCFDALLGGINREFAAKRSSARLGATVATVLPYDELAARLDPKTRTEADRRGRVWDTQFKLLPLYRRLWHEYGLA